MEYYSAIKRDTFDSVLIRGKKLEAIIQARQVRKRKTNIIY